VEIKMKTEEGIASAFSLHDGYSFFRIDLHFPPKYGKIISAVL